MNTQTRFSQSPLSLCFKFPNFPPFPSRLFVFHHNSQFWFLRNQSIFFSLKMVVKSKGIPLATLLLILFLSAIFPTSFSNQVLNSKKPIPSSSASSLGSSVAFQIKGNVYPLGYVILCYDMLCILWLVQQSSSESHTNSLFIVLQNFKDFYFFLGMDFFPESFELAVLLWFELC